jgi:hypothetical protein
MSKIGDIGKEPDLMKAAIIARSRKYLYPLSLESVERMCRNGTFKTAVKLGSGRRAHWWVNPWEVLAHKANSNTLQLRD